MAEELIATIDRNSYEPAYAQLVRILLGQIAAGMFRPGDRLPSEAQLCQRYGVRCVYQVHHNSLVASASGAYALVAGLPAESVAIALDPGNQASDGMENWSRSAKLLGEYLCGLGVKDVSIRRDPAGADQPDKGWQRSWCPIYEGVTDWREVVSALNEVDFAGTFVFMPFYDENDPEAMTGKLRREVAYLRGIVSEVSRPA